MVLNGIIMVFIIFLIYAVSDIIATFSKAYLSMVFVAAIIFMFAFWFGLPKGICVDTGFMAIGGNMAIGFFLAHLGTSFSIKTFTQDWKAVVISIVSVVCIAFGCYFIGRNFMDPSYALAAAPIAAGGNVSYYIMQPTLEGLNRPDVITFCVLALCFQTMAGVPVASFLCKKIGLGLHQDYLDGKLVAATAAANNGQEKKKLLPGIPKKWLTDNVYFFELALCAALGSLFEQATGFNRLVATLVFAFILTQLGLMEPNPLQKSGAQGLIVSIALITIFNGLSGSTPEMVLSMIVPLLIILFIGLCIMFAVSIPLAKLLHYEWKIAVVIATTAYFGFMCGYIVSQEVARAISVNDEERALMEQYFMPKMLIGGILSMFIVSAVCASIMVQWF